MRHSVFGIANSIVVLDCDFFFLFWLYVVHLWLVSGVLCFRYKRGAWLGKITRDYKLIAVSGSHGNFILAWI